MRSTRPRTLWAMTALLVTSQLAGCGYGRMQELDELARTARTDIEIQLQRRAELVPNLIETLSAYSSINQEAAAMLADARVELVRAVRSSDLPAMQESSAKLGAAMARLLSDAGRNSALESDPGFRVLRSQLDGTEDQIRVAGGAYNEAVRSYNEYIRGFPQLVTAKVVGATELEPFDYMDETPILSPTGE